MRKYRVSGRVASISIAPFPCFVPQSLPSPAVKKAVLQWSLPNDLINAVRWHHYPEGLENSNLHPEIVYLANLLCHSSGDSEPDEDQLNMPYSSVLDRLRIEPEQYEVFAEKARNWIKQLSDTLTFD